MFVLTSDGSALEPLREFVHDPHAAQTEIDQPKAGLPCAIIPVAMFYSSLAYLQARASCNTHANNDRTRSDNSVVANPHTSLIRDTITNVHVLANADLLRDFSAAVAFCSFWVRRGFERRDGDAGSDPRVPANGDPGRVE